MSKSQAAHHPVPRIEYVETPFRRAVAATPSTAKVPNPQPWHVRYIGANGEPLAVSENLTSAEACDVNALAVASLFDAGHPVQMIDNGRRHVADLTSGEVVAEVRAGAGSALPVVYVRVES